jgi:hypothetical protein
MQSSSDVFARSASACAYSHQGRTYGRRHTHPEGVVLITGRGTPKGVDEVVRVAPAPWKPEVVQRADLREQVIVPLAG